MIGLAANPPRLFLPAINPPVTIQSPWTASGTSARAAFAQSTSFCTMGAPLSPIAPTISPSTLMGKPPPHAATRARLGMPAKSDGSPWIKSKKSCVETPNRAVYALFCAISMVGIEAPSIRLNALRLPPSSRIATFSVTPSSLAFATAAFTIFCASSEEILCFFTTLTIGHLPLFGSICLSAFVLFCVHSAIDRELDPEFLEHGLRLEIGGPERDGLAVPERPVVNDLNDRVGPGNADVEYSPGV